MIVQDTTTNTNAVLLQNGDGGNFGVIGQTNTLDGHGPGWCRSAWRRAAATKPS